MTGIDKSSKRAVAAIVLLVLAASALRGYLPARGREHPQDTSSNPASPFIVATLVSVSLAIVAVAIVMRLRDRRAKPAGRDLPPGGTGPAAKASTWRFVLIALGLVMVWLLINLLLPRLAQLFGIDHPPPGTSARPPATGTPRPPPSPPPQGDGMLFKYLAGTTVIFMLLIAMATVVAARRRSAADNAEPLTGAAAEQSTPAAAGSLARAAERGLAEIGDVSREPREAIIACYAAMELELMNMPVAAPQDCDTPTEVLARAVEHHALHAESATQLVDLFEEARFSPHVMNEGHRDIAVRTLRLVLAEMRSAV